MRILADPDDRPFALVSFFFQDRVSELVTGGPRSVQDIAFRQVPTY